jgi:hypothetical protein
MIKKYRKSRIVFSEWNSASMGHYNTGSIICESCNFSRSLMRNEHYTNYKLNNKIEREHDCPKCSDREWYWLPPSTRTPRNKSSKSIWNKFWKQLKGRKFN